MNLKRLNLKSFLGIITICIIQGVCLSCSSDDNETTSSHASLAGIWQGDYAQWVIQPDGTYEVINEVIYSILKSATIIQYTIKGRFMSR